MSERPASLRNQAEQWAAEGKRLADAGREVAAFDLYRKAADSLPGAPWLQLRTAELASKLKRHDLALAYFRRSADGFCSAGFERRAIAPLRMAWSVARGNLPGTSDAFSEIARELAALLTRLCLTADAEELLEQTRDAIRHEQARSDRPAAVREPAAQRESWRPTLTPRPAR